MNEELLRQLQYALEQFDKWSDDLSHEGRNLLAATIMERRCYLREGPYEEISRIMMQEYGWELDGDIAA